MEVSNGQSILDVTIQATGTADNALSVALQNGLSLTDDLTVGNELEIDTPTEQQQLSNLAYYQERNIKPATGVTLEEQTVAPYGGIEYMGIEIDFIVS